MKRPITILWAFAFCTALGLFFAVQNYLLGDESMNWATALRWALPQWYVWGLLAPVVFKVERWAGHGRSLTARLAQQLPLGVAFTLLAIVIRLFIRPYIGNNWPVAIPRYFIERF